MSESRNHFFSECVCVDSLDTLPHGLIEVLPKPKSTLQQPVHTHYNSVAPADPLDHAGIAVPEDQLFISIAQIASSECSSAFAYILSMLWISRFTLAMVESLRFQKPPDKNRNANDRWIWNRRTG
jgi:hypothetical protein